MRVLLMCEQLEGWETSRMLVRDGGECFADVTWNMTTGAYHLQLRFSPELESMGIASAHPQPSSR